MTALPTKLKDGGYKTHIVGKWDMGMATPDHTPAGRGFDTSLIYFEHMNYYYTQHICPTGTGCDMTTQSWLTDLWTHDESDVPGPDGVVGHGAFGLNDTAYIETLFNHRLMDIVNNHSMDDGNLYLQYTSHVAHWPLQVPEEWYNRYSFVTDDEPGCGSKIPWVWPGANESAVLSCRRQYEAMVGFVDETVGNLTSLLQAKGWWNDTLMIFTADNGGSIGTDENAASNYPLRGGKYWPWEGGIRSAAFVSGGYLPPSVAGSVLESPLHMADWYGTLCGLAGVDPFDHKANTSIPPLPPVDSLDMWPLISGQTDGASPRTEVPVTQGVLLHFNGSSSAGPIWKLMIGSHQAAGWMSPTYPNSTSPANDPFQQTYDCGATGCLFDVRLDPGEHTDVAGTHPDILASMTARITLLEQSFFTNSDTGTKICPPSVTGDCACWAAENVWQGYLGPWQK